MLLRFVCNDCLHTVLAECQRDFNRVEGVAMEHIMRGAAQNRTRLRTGYEVSEFSQYYSTTNVHVGKLYIPNALHLQEINFDETSWRIADSSICKPRRGCALRERLGSQTP